MSKENGCLHCRLVSIYEDLGNISSEKNFDLDMAKVKVNEALIWVTSVLGRLQQEENLKNDDA